MRGSRIRIASPLFFLLLCTAAVAEEVTIRGTVTDGDAPIAGATVQLRPWLSPFEEDVRWLTGDDDPVEALASTKTDDRGAFELRAPPGGSYQVEVAAEGRRPMVNRVAHLFDGVELRPAVLIASGQRPVRVEDAAGTPLAGARVWPLSPASSRSGWRPVTRAAVTGKDGTATLDMGGGRLTLAASAPGFVPAVEQADGETATVELAAGKATTVEVRDAEDRTVAGALVRQAIQRTAWPLGISDEDGRVAVYPPADGGLEVTVETADGHWATATIDAPRSAESEPVKIVLEAPLVVSGQVMDALTDRPLAGARVWLGNDPHRFADSGRDGGYRLPAPAAERRGLRLGAAAPGHLRISDFLQAVDGQTQYHNDFALPPAAILRGRVTGEDGRGISGAEVSSDSWLAEGGFTRSGADGRFRLRAVRNKVYPLTVSKPGYLSGHVEASVAEDGSDAVVVVLHQGPPGFGYVTDAGGQPVSGAEVTLLYPPRPDQHHSYSASSFRQAATSEDGRFEVFNLAPGAAELRARASGYAEKTVRGLEIGAEVEGPVDLGTVALEPGVDLHGRTVDPDGRPLAEVEVRASAWQPDPRTMDVFGSPETAATSDADGSFVIEDLARGTKVGLRGSREGYTPAQLTGVELPAAEPVVLVLEPAGKIRGTVVDRLGKPVPEAMVMIQAESAAGGGAGVGRKSDSDGRFELEALASGRLVVTAVAASLGRAEHRLEIAPGEIVDGLRLVLSPGAVVEGRVLGPDGDPIAGAEVKGYSTESDSPALLRERSDVHGRFQLDGLEPGPLALWVTTSGFPTENRQLEVRPGTQTVEIRFGAPREIHGRVVDEGWNPVGGAGVSASDGAGRRSGATSAADGTFVIKGLPDGRYRLKADKTGFAPTELQREVELAGGPVFDVEIRLSAGGAVAGRVLGLDPEPLAGVLVVLVVLVPGRSEERIWLRDRAIPVDALGGYRFEHRQPGDWTVVAIEPASGRTVRGFTTLAPGDEEAILDLELTDGLTLTGRVLVDGDPADGVRVAAEGLDVASTGDAFTDYRGGFRVVDLAPGRYRLEARRQELVARREIELRTDQAIEIELATHDVGGRVVDAEDSGPLAGATVLLLPDSGGEPSTDVRAPRLRTDARGAFRFAGVAEGSYRLRAEHHGYGPVDELLEVAGISLDGVELRLARVEGLTLKVLRADGGIPKWVHVVALDGSGVPGVSRSLPVTEDGTARLSNLPPGSWLLVARAHETGVAWQPVDAPGDPVTVVLPPAGKVDVRVPELAGTVELATLTVTGPGGQPFLSIASSYPVHLLREWPVRDGRATVEGLPPGRWQLTATTADGRTWSGSATVPANGGDVSLELE